MLKTYNNTRLIQEIFQNKKRISNCEVITIQILAETEYQDLYRVTDGVLLVVNKFKPIEYEQEKYFRVWKAKQSKYNKGCQDWLKVLKEDFHDEYSDITVKKGTVTYMDRPVEPTTNEADFRYQIKTTGDLFSGDADEMENMLSDILYRIRQGKVRDGVGWFVKVGV